MVYHSILPDEERETCDGERAEGSRRTPKSVITDDGLRHFHPPKIRHANKTRLPEGLVSVPNVSGKPWHTMAAWHRVCVCVHAEGATRFG